MKGRWYPECELSVTEMTMVYQTHIVNGSDPHRIGPMPAGNRLETKCSVERNQ
jgi:hypothetical protein